MTDEQRGPTPSEVVRDRPASPQSIQAEGGPAPEGTESSYRQRGGKIEEPPEAGYRLADVYGSQSLGGEDMGPDERIDGDELREEDVTEEDRLSDDERENVGPAELDTAGEDVASDERVDG